MSWKEFFRPTKWKIAVAILIPMTFALLGLSLFFVELELYKPVLVNGVVPIIPTASQNLPAFNLENIISIVAGYLLFAAVSYPFSCSLLAIWNRYKHQNPKQLKGAFLALTLIGIIFFNPLGARIISYFISYIPYSLYFNLAYAPCGVTFSSLIPNTPAEKSGLIPHQIISNVNGIAIQNVTDFENFFANFKPGDNVTVRTIDGKSYQLILMANPSDPRRAMIGIANAQTGYCKKT